MVRLDSDERALVSRKTHGLTVGASEFIGAAGMANAINESGLLHLPSAVLEPLVNYSPPSG
jgi:hypothetical protein